NRFVDIHKRCSAEGSGRDKKAIAHRQSPFYIQSHLAATGVGFTLLLERGCFTISANSDVHSSSMRRISSSDSGVLSGASANSFRFSSLVILGNTDLIAGLARLKRIAACPMVRSVPSYRNRSLRTASRPAFIHLNGRWFRWSVLSKCLSGS